MDWALAEHHIPDSQFGFCPTRNTNQPLFILRHIRYCKKEKNEGVNCFSWTSLLPTTVFQERNFGDLQKIKTPQYLRDIIQTMYTGCLYLLIDGDKTSKEVAPNKGLKKAALWVPFCIPFIPMKLTDSWPCREVLPLPWIQFRSLIMIMLMTLLSLQTQLNVYSSS